MTSLESIVLPLPDSRALVEAGIVLETALMWCQPSWGPISKGIEYVGTRGNMYRPAEEEVLCSAPVLSELLDAIRAGAIKKASGMKGDETTIILSSEYAGGAACGVRTALGTYGVAQASTDLLAAAALLMEVSK
jgi:hypothetical protein